jgi:hypothetical protein
MEGLSRWLAPYHDKAATPATSAGGSAAPANKRSRKPANNEAEDDG